MMLKTALIALFAFAIPAAAPAKPAADLAGLYVARQLNYHNLPRIERVPSQDGWEHWFKLMEAMITLRPDGQFIASFKYYRQHVKPRAAVSPGPMLNESYKGKYSLKGTQITFVPYKTKQHKNVRPIVGTLAGAQLMIPYIVAEGQSKHPLRLDLHKEGNW
jgi:hypothetical protein